MELTRWKTIFLFIALHTNYVHGQQNVPSISDILSGTSILESAVMDLSSSAADFIKNAPIAPPGHVHSGPGLSPDATHVDMPGEHGNANDFPVIHRENAPALTTGGVINDGFMEPTVLSPDGFGRPIVNTLDMKPMTSPETGLPKGIFHGSNVFHNVDNVAGLNSNNFVDLASLTDSKMPMGNSAVPVFKPDHTIGEPIMLVLPPVGKSDGFHDGHAVDVLGTGSIPLAKEVFGVPPAGDGFVGDGFLVDAPITPLRNVHGVAHIDKARSDGFLPVANVHVDKPGEHGNLGHEPVVHKDIGLPGVPDLATLTGSGPTVHVDLPGEHGNMHNIATVHREPDMHVMPHGAGSVHVDLPDEHGNTANTAVVHRGPAPLPVTAHGLGSVHVDLPGEHGNMGGAALIHREPGMPVPHPAGIPVGQPHGAELGNVHIDLPGEHGNTANTPVVHRQTGFPSMEAMGPITNQLPPVALPQHSGPVHVDLPGQHGNMGNTALVHREHGFPASPTSNQGFPSTHVDLPGEHRNMGNAAVIHREGGHGLMPSNTGPVPILADNVHIDRPGEHGNFGDLAVVHREQGLPMGGVVPGMPVNTAIPIGSVHIDHPGEHGNFGDRAVVHREPSFPVGGMPPMGPLALGPALSGGIGPHSDHSGIHIDAPGEHGNPHNEPALHLPPGATVADARAAGVIPPGDLGMGVPPMGVPDIHQANIHHDMHPGAGTGVPAMPPHNGHTGEIHIDAHDVPPHGPVVHTGVFPGAANVPVKPNLLDITGGNGIFGAGPIGGPVSTGLGVVGNRSIRRNRNGRRRGNRRRGGRRRDRGRVDIHDHHHPTPTPAPTKNPGSGVIVIRHNRPNPFGALANAMRGMLGGGNGGGLLGSILQSASGANRGPPGIRIIGSRPVMQGPNPRNMVQSLLGNLFGKR